MSKHPDNSDGEPSISSGKTRRSRRPIVRQELPPGDDSSFSGIEGPLRYVLEHLDEVDGIRVTVIDTAELEGGRRNTERTRDRIMDGVIVSFTAVVIE